MGSHLQEALLHAAQREGEPLRGPGFASHTPHSASGDVDLHRGALRRNNENMVYVTRGNDYKCTRAQLQLWTRAHTHLLRCGVEARVLDDASEQGKVGLVPRIDETERLGKHLQGSSMRRHAGGGGGLIFRNDNVGPSREFRTTFGHCPTAERG